MAASGDATRDARALFATGITLEEYNRRLIQRTAPARARHRRVADFINRSHPALRQQILDAANEAWHGRWILPGTSGQYASIGSPPAWFTPRYDNEEYLWGLNRMPHWKVLLQAHALTGEDRYAEKVASELDDWIARTHPVPSLFRPDGTVDPESLGNSAPAPWRALEQGVRLFETWPRVIDHLAGTKHLPPERLERMVRSMAEQAAALAIVSPATWPEADHNHYFIEMLGVLSAGVVCRELEAAPYWTTQALRELQRCIARQFTADGGHVEGCPRYHNVCVILLVRFLGLARAAGSPVADTYNELCSAALVYSVQSTRPTGQTVPWGDSNPKIYYDLPAVWAYQVTHDIRPLQHIAQLIGAEAMRKLCLAEIWEIDDPADFYARMVLAPEPAYDLAWFDRGNDQVMARTSWQREALSVFFACHAPLHPGSAHQHIDLGGFDFCALGRSMVADPGPLTYRECADRRIFKESAYHSVLTIDGREPFEYLSRWRYSPQQEGRVAAMHREPGLVQIDSFHRNYSPALCHRTVALVADRMLVVIDWVEGLAPASTRQIYFHLDAEKVTWNEAGQIARSDHGEAQLAIFSSGGMGCELLPGRISEVWEVTRPSTRLRFSDRGGPPDRVHVAVLLPFRTGSEWAPVTGLRVFEDRHTCEFLQGGRKFSLNYARSSVPSQG